MAWAEPRTFVVGETTTAAHLNQDVKNNANALIAARNNIDTSATRASTAYGDLTDTSGPGVTVDTGDRTSVVVMLGCQMANDAAGSGIGFMGVAVSGATTRAADDDHSYSYLSAVANDDNAFSAVFELTDLTAGSNTFTAKYRTNSAGNTGTFSRRKIAVLL